MSRSSSARSSMSSPQRRVLASAISVALATGAGLTQAETNGSETDGAAQTGAAVLPTISVEGTQAQSFKVDKASNPRCTAPLLDTPQTIHVVPAAVIEEREDTSLHHVTPVTCGARLASFFWIQSMVREDSKTELAAGASAKPNRSQFNWGVPQLTEKVGGYLAGRGECH